MTTIKGGNNGNVADVTDRKALKVDAVIESRLESASRDDEKAFVWSSTYAATAADEIIYIANTSVLDTLVIDSFTVGASAACVFTLFEVTSGTAAGSTITAENINLGASGTASATSFGGAAVTGSLTGPVIRYAGVSAASEFDHVDLSGGVILDQNSALAVTVSATATVYVNITGHYE